MRTLSVYYTLYYLNEVVPAASPVEMSLDDVVNKLAERLWSDGDFFGMFDGKGHALQVIFYADNDLYHADIPSPTKDGSHGAFWDRAALLEHLANLPETFTPKTIPGLIFSTWDENVRPLPIQNERPPPAIEYRDIATGLGFAFATKRVSRDGKRVGYMYRETPDNEDDSGWRFLAGNETREYMDVPENHAIVDVNTVANLDPEVLPFLDSPPGSSFSRNYETGRFELDPPDAEEESEG